VTLTKKGIGRMMARRRKAALLAKNKAMTHCKNGHPFTPQNTVVISQEGFRICRICRNDARKAAIARKKGKA
jgi:hypothetical protein